MGNPLKVLLVDDELPVLGVISEFLKWRNCQVFMATNGADAIAVNEKENPDLIILDLCMPVLDGIQTLQEIRKTDKEVRVIILSGFIDTYNPRLSCDLDVSQLLHKPFDSETIYRAIDIIFKDQK